jgi:ubiquitin C
VDIFPVRDTILDVKRRIRAGLSIPLADQRLLFDGRELPDDFAIVNLPGISRDGEDSFIRLVVRAKPIQIRIQARDGRRISLTVRTSDFISEVKEQIEEHEAIPIREQHLFLGSRELGDRLILGDCIIRKAYRIAADITIHLCRPGDVIRALRSRFTVGSSLEITINDLDSGVISCVRVRATDAISTVAPSRRWDSLGVRTRAWWGGRQLDATKSFRDYFIQNGITLHLDVEMHIFVKTLTGRHVIFDVGSSDLVEDLKARIHEREGVPPVRQRLTFAGRLLEEGNTLSDCSVQGDATVNLGISPGA